MSPRRTTNKSSQNEHVLIGLGRAFGASLIFAVPMFMTMEMWWIGFYMDRLRLALLLLTLVPLLLFIARRIGFEKTSRWRDAARDTAVAMGVGLATTVTILFVMGVITLDTTLDTIAGQITIQLVPTSLGALLGRSQLGQSRLDRQEPSEAASPEASANYWSEILLMLTGALFLCLNVAPTEEVVLIAFKMTPWHAMALVVLSIALMHAFVYVLAFQGQEPLPAESSGWSIFLRFTVVGYVAAFAMSLYILWTIGRTDGNAMQATLMAAVVLTFPASIGAAAARLVL